MKKALLCALAAIASLQIVSAQDKGDKYIGGIIGVSTNSVSIEDSSITATNVGVAPEFGYFVADKLRLGAALGYNLSTASGETSHSLTIGPSLAYYVKLGNRFYYTPEIAVAFAYTYSEGVSACGFAAGLSLGSFEFRPTTHFGMSVSLLSLEYAHLSYSEFEATGSAVTFQLGIKPSVGLKYYF